jgi:LmbE family N-acetylglucosaminyl deacetylase
MNPSRRTADKAARLLTMGLSDTRPGRLFLRRALSALVRAALRLRSRALAFDDISSVVVISPHPDDEAFGCGGTLSLMARRQTALGLIFITDGSASHPGHPTVPPSELARIRRDEARAAAAALEVKWEETTFLDIPDGSLAHLGASESREWETKIAGLLARAKPTAILLPGRGDGSTEHEAAFTGVARALKQMAQQPRVLEFPVWSWWNPTLLAGQALSCRRIWRVDIRAVREKKARALASYASQTLPISPQLDPALPPGFSAMFLGGSEYFFEW